MHLICTQLISSNTRENATTSDRTEEKKEERENKKL